MYLLMAYLNYALNIEAEVPRNLCSVVIPQMCEINEYIIKSDGKAE